MGLLVEGEWHDKWYDTSGDGRFQREEAGPGVEPEPVMGAQYLHQLYTRHYYESHPTINPTGVVPVGPEKPF